MKATPAGRVRDVFAKVKPWLGGAGWLLWIVSLILLFVNPSVSNLVLLVVIAGVSLIGATVGPLLVAMRCRKWLGTWPAVVALCAFAALIQGWPRLQGFLAPAVRLPAIDQVSAVLTLELWIFLGLALVGLFQRRDAGPLLLGSFSLVWIWVLALGIVRAGSAANIVLTMLAPTGLWWYNALTSLACCLVPVGLGGTLYHFLRLVIRELRQEWP